MLPSQPALGEEAQEQPPQHHVRVERHLGKARLDLLQKDCARGAEARFWLGARPEPLNLGLELDLLGDQLLDERRVAGHEQRRVAERHAGPNLPQLVQGSREVQESLAAE